jgi:protein ImuB
MNFRYLRTLHTLRKASGPERIEREWWLKPGEHRDYYWAENEHGRRYWIFRSGHYDGDSGGRWYLHGFFG